MVDGDARSELLSADWNGEWMRLQAGRRRADDSFEWDKRARHFRPLETAPYARDFMKLLALKPGESVLDMGVWGWVDCYSACSGWTSRDCR